MTLPTIQEAVNSNTVGEEFSYVYITVRPWIVLINNLGSDIGYSWS